MFLTCGNFQTNLVPEHNYTHVIPHNRFYAFLAKIDDGLICWITYVSLSLAQPHLTVIVPTLTPNDMKVIKAVCTMDGLLQVNHPG